MLSRRAAPAYFPFDADFSVALSREGITLTGSVFYFQKLEL